MRPCDVTAIPRDKIQQSLDYLMQLMQLLILVAPGQAASKHVLNQYRNRCIEPTVLVLAAIEHCVGDSCGRLPVFGPGW